MCVLTLTLCMSACSKDATSPAAQPDASDPAGEGGDSGGDSGGASGAGAGGAGAGAAGGGGSSGDGNAELFDPAELPRFDIELSKASITSLGKAPDTYVRAAFRYKGETLTDIGIRIKGEGSLRDLSKKSAFKIKFDEFVDAQAFRGLKRLTLNNLVEDPSFIAERLAYDVYRLAKLPAPRCNSALVYVNGDYYGVYANVESEDKTFLRRWFTSDAGNLYEEGQVDFEPGKETEFDLETNETKNDRRDLANLIAVFQAARPATFLQDMDSVLDTKQFLRFSALEAAVNQWDMYSYTLFYPNNFRIYHDPDSGKFVFLPWGMDLAMKPFPYSGRAHIPVFELARYEDLPNERPSAGLLFRRCMESASCKAAYADVVREVATLYDDADLEAVAKRYYAQVRDHVYEDTRKELSNDDFDAAYQSVLTTIRTRTAALRADLAE
jgi:hypothetical protein